MSASQEKKRRQLTRDEEIDKVSAETREAQKKKTLKCVRNVVIAVVVVLVIAAIFVVNSNLFYTKLTAVEMNGVRYNAAEMNYLYKSSLYSFVNQQESYAKSLGMDTSNYLQAMGLDTSKPLDEQPCYLDSTLSWRDYFCNQAIDTLKEITVLNEAAEVDGYVLPQEDKDTIENNISSLSYYASVTGYQTVAQYLAAQYGKGVTEDVVRKMMTLSTIASNYASQKQASYTYSSEEMEAWYEEHKDTYDTVTYMAYFLSGAVDESITEPTDEDKTNAMADAKKLADEMAKEVTDEESFAEAAEGTTAATVMGRSLDASYSEWLLDAARKSGDVEVAEATDGYYVVLFLGRDDNHYNMKQIRHILVKAEADEDGLYTEEAKAAAKEQAQAYLKEWKAGDATEESFAAMANEHSDDAGSNTNGGLYEAVMKGAFVQGFEDFAFASNRKPGDTGIAYGESSGSYAGYHVMYYVGEAGLYSDYVADNVMRSDDFTAWKEEIVAACSYTSGNGFRFVA